jgi:hypothetical protein
MDGAELRLGNYVNVPREDQSPFRIDAFEYLSDKFIKVAMFHPEHGENFHPLTWYGKDLTPILVTKEWLLNFGFKKVEDFDGFINVYQLKGFKVSLDDYINVFVDWVEEGDSVCCYEQLHVHTLQNLYYELMSKEELIYKSENDG